MTEREYRQIMAVLDAWDDGERMGRKTGRIQGLTVGLGAGFLAGLMLAVCLWARVSP